MNYLNSQSVVAVYINAQYQVIYGLLNYLHCIFRNFDSNFLVFMYRMVPQYWYVVQFLQYLYVVFTFGICVQYGIFSIYVGQYLAVLQVFLTLSEIILTDTANQGKMATLGKFFHYSIIPSQFIIVLEELKLIIIKFFVQYYCYLCMVVSDNHTQT